MNTIYFNYDDINLIPEKSIVNSRKEFNASVTLGSMTFKLPICPANMESVINEELCEQLAKENYFYIMHRFNIDQVRFVRNMKSKGLYSSISIGVNQESYDLLDELVNEDLVPHIITIDVAHEHSTKTEAILKYIKNKLKINSYIIAGNIITTKAAKFLISLGVDAVKVGIGNGSVCSTYMETGFGSRDIQASIIRDINNYLISFKKRNKNKDIKIIADGGIKYRGDITKALVMGADMVMSGSLFAELYDSPGKIISDNYGAQYKVYHGSASAHQSGKTNRIEGIKQQLEVKNSTYLEELRGIEEALQSAISYAGGKELSIFKTTEYIIK